MKTKSLVSAVLITATIQGSLLWGVDHLAVTSAAATAQAPVTSARAVSSQPRPELLYVTLAPVLVVGKRGAPVDEQATTQANATTPVTAQPAVAQDAHI